MNFYNNPQHCTGRSRCLIPLISLALVFSLDAFAVQEDPSVQPDPGSKPEAAELADRSQRPVTPPKGFERVPVTEAGRPVDGEAPSELLDAIIADLMTQKNIRRDDITVIRSESVIWPDGSLGCPKPGEMVTQVPVHGYRVVLRWAQKEFSYHASAKGQFFLCEGTFHSQAPLG